MTKTKKRGRSPSPDGFVPTSEICAKLYISRYTLQRLREQKVLKNGEHWIDINPYSAPRYRYHLENCKTRLIELREENEPSHIKQGEVGDDRPSASTHQRPAGESQP
ncbi:hypothetical protein [Egbenema bharatensis]|uniref:hypothetical protein n=1 Tax=Egbenema bharatensis TaxID=3463334 RepID=UPI003A857FB0